MKWTRRVLALVAALFFSSPLPTSAQPDLGGWFRPELGQVPVRADYRVTWFPDEKVEGQPAKLGLNRHDFSFTAPIWQNPFEEWTFTTKVRSEIFNTGALLPD